jgi:hypothetical protein
MKAQYSKAWRVEFKARFVYPAPAFCHSKPPNLYKDQRLREIAREDTRSTDLSISPPLLPLSTVRPRRQYQTTWKTPISVVDLTSSCKIHTIVISIHEVSGEVPKSMVVGLYSMGRSSLRV